MQIERLISFLGLFAMMFFAWLMSSNRRKINPRIIAGGLALQFVFALLILKTEPGREAFDYLGELFTSSLEYVEVGAKSIFEVYPSAPKDAPISAEANRAWAHPATLLRTFAFGVLPTIIFYSALMSVLYHLGVMQLIVRMFAVIMQKTLGTSGAETLSAAANIFVGQTEAPLVIKPYIKGMTLSELNVVMVGGFATIAGGVLAAYVGFGIDAGHLMTASVISAPAALMIAKILQPETDVPQTADGSAPDTEKTRCVNVVEAAAEGASSGLMLALNVGAMLIAFVALVAMCNGLIGWVGAICVGEEAARAWTLERGFGYVFAPFAWLMGIPADECLASGEILGTKTVLNEFVAYLSLAGAKGLSPRTVTILTYALCGFANFSSIGIQLGGIGGIAPERRGDLAKLGLRAMLGGTLAAFMTACIAGILIPADAEPASETQQPESQAATRTPPIAPPELRCSREVAELVSSDFPNADSLQEFTWLHDADRTEYNSHLKSRHRERSAFLT